ncbi:MAG: threonine--tRNA ligase [Planctomycetes bacterium]|nr:threonine--tRNA ligase [Planctomycetota bacterium]MCC7396164.1 threonine--tRNA ligase [Planctomycetota bacterium]
MPIQLTLPDGSVREYAAGTTGMQVAESIGKGLAKAAVGIELDGEVQSLQLPIQRSAKMRIHTRDSKEGLEVIRHSAAHVMADAVKRIKPQAKLWKGPPVDDPRYGFYYDIDFGNDPITADDLPKIEQLMQQIIAADVPFVRQELSRDHARALMVQHGEDYKVATIDKIPADQAISFFQSGDFVDLCKGPHVPSTGKIGKGIAVLALAGAYFGDDAGNKMLTRIYGHAFADEKAMVTHRHNLEEAAKRDHRRLGIDLDLFSTMGDLGAGLILWHPKGGFVRHKVEEFWRQEHLKGGYDIVYSPHIAKADLWQTSGHLDFYKDSMYSGIDIDGAEYRLKPMNCPFHVQIFKSKRRSYRELPFRWAELGTVYRYENQGSLHGLLRVRGFTQDDAHLFLAEDQVEGEIERCLKFVISMLRAFGFNDYAMNLSTRPAKSVGSDASWEKATTALRLALEAIGLPYQVDEGGGAFYGPKIDVKIKDTLGRTWQCSTIQCDFNLPERFDMSYIDASGNKARPVMVHRALLGSLERFFGILVEHHGGAFPTWLAPVQAVLLSVGDRHAEAVRQASRTMKDQLLRVEADDSGDKIGQKIRHHLFQEKVPFVGVVGDQEVQNGTVTVRSRTDGDLGTMTMTAFAELLQRLVAERK